MFADSVHVGKVIKTHGVNGAMQIQILNRFAGVEFDAQYLFLEFLGGIVPYQIINLRYKVHNEIIVEVDTIDREEAALKLVGSNSYFKKEDIINDLESDNDLWTIEGYEVVDTNLGKIGVVQSIIEINNNPLIQIDNNGTEILVPLNEEFIVEIREKEQVLLISAPEGLIDLYLD